MSFNLKTILVVDDKASSRELVRTVLEHCGYRVAEAADGPEALNAIETQNPDLVLLDVHMPGMDGYEVIRKVRENPKSQTLPVVALTASAMQGDKERALSAGFSSYLSKPVSLSTLRRELASLLS